MRTVLAAIAVMAFVDSYLQIDTWLTVKREARIAVAERQTRLDEANRRLAGCLSGDTIFIFEDGWVTRPTRRDVGPALTKEEVKQL